MPLQCSGIACIDDDICEMDHGGVRLRVRIDDVRRLTLGYGFQTLHPKLQNILGIILLAPGAWAIHACVRKTARANASSSARSSRRRAGVVM